MRILVLAQLFHQPDQASKEICRADVVGEGTAAHTHAHSEGSPSRLAAGNAPRYKDTFNLYQWN